ncbi:hypothetical protein DSO57_1002571 [Entomophthora muscae]|uniref:Uncharacterized protein n=1 Tax=Entomophthora muscae TaxID=34485 RepID=A0ACC2U722_9FUNG|nr:hypothetical protein DSO57_1002571 [Entomophthora muscae]
MATVNIFSVYMGAVAVNFGGVLFIGMGAVYALATIAIVTIGVAVVLVGVLAFIAIAIFSAIAV